MKYVSVQADIPLPPAVPMLTDLLHQAGFESFVVGGAVRDYRFWEKSDRKEAFKPKDIDICTDAMPWQVTQLLQQCKRVTAFPKGEAFGVISAVIDGKEYEIATYREEWYDPDTGDGRRPDKVAYSTADKDAQRRDLTMNALFYDVRAKEIRDYNLTSDGQGQGLLDIDNRVARPVGQASERFREDRLRIMRLVRFFCRFNNGLIAEHLDADVLAAVHEFREMVGVSPERIVAEFEAGLASCQSPVNYIRSLEALGLFPAIFPGANIPNDVERIGDCHNDVAVLAWLLRDVQGVRKYLTELKYPSDVFMSVEFLVQLYHFNEAKLSIMLRRRDLWKQEVEPNAQLARRLIDEANVLNFAKIAGNAEEMYRFLRYEPQVRSEAYMDLPPAERGKAMNRDEIAAYRQAK